jgi:hypothetical protein
MDFLTTPVYIPDNQQKTHSEISTMKKQASRVAMCEPLESRRLLSANFATIRADVDKLVTDSALLKTAVKTFEADLVAKVAIGTPGLGSLDADLNGFKTHIAGANATLTADLAVVNSDRGTGAEAGAVAQLQSDANAEHNEVKGDVATINTPITKHPTLISDHAKLVTDEAAVTAAFTIVKADGKQLLADVA